MADLPLSRHLVANAVALAPSAVVLLALWGLAHLSGAAALLAFCAIGVGTGLLVQRHLGALSRFARFVGELSGESEPAMPRLSFAPAAAELATAAATLATGWRRQRAAIDNLAASAQAIVDGHVLREDLSTTYRHHRQNDVPLLVGWNAEEGKDLAPEILGTGDFTAASHRGLVTKLLGYAPSDALMARYPGATAEVTTSRGLPVSAHANTIRARSASP